LKRISEFLGSIVSEIKKKFENLKEFNDKEFKHIKQMGDVASEIMEKKIKG